MWKSLFILLSVPVIANAQGGGQAMPESKKGIRFVEEMSWDQVKEKAKIENKFIFLDAYATWCAPCKEMDRRVYPDEKVGKFINERFISVKVQMDSSAKDGDQVRKWYADAHSIMIKYEISTLPTFLFFSPDGKIVHKGISKRDTDNFIALAAAALDSSKQYFTLLSKYKRGEMDDEDMPKLEKAARELRDNTHADLIARDYKYNYLDKLSEEQLCKKEILEFMSRNYNMVSSKDTFFRLVYFYPDKVDQIMYPGCAMSWTNYIINKEDIESKLWKNGKPVTMKPDWNRISKDISRKYNSNYAQELVSAAQLTFYKRIGNWREYAKLRDHKIRRQPPKRGEGVSSDQWALNSDAWDIFLNCNDKDILLRALDWVDLAIRIDQPDPNIQFFDTKANLLYKMGKVKEAIKLEGEAREQGIMNAQKRGQKKGEFFDEFTATIKKMEKGEPTWPIR